MNLLSKRKLVPIGLIASAALIAAVLVSAPSSAAPILAFSEDFSSPTALQDHFDYGYSGQNPWEWGNGSGTGQETAWMGDHNMACEAPTTQRPVAQAGNQAHLDYSQLFWQCAPSGPTSGHLMTAVNTVGYNIAWFSPKQTFTELSRVCWDINETDMSGRKWTQVLFVDDADAHRYPVTIGSEQAAEPNPRRAASGGFDLGYVSPEFSDISGATTGVISGGSDGQHQTAAGFKLVRGVIPAWFQNGQFTTPDWGATTDRLYGITDKATRYTQCLENQPGNVVRLTEGIPGGTRVIDMPGQIPQGSTRIVFEDDNYNPPKDDAYDPSVLTWHWDNVQVFAKGSGGSTTTTVAPSTTTTASTTTTVAPTTTQPPTTTTTVPLPPACHSYEDAWAVVTVCPK